MDEDLKAEVPDLTDPLLAEFSNRYQLKNAPEHLNFADRGYPASQCHLSAKHCAMTNGGRRVHGWAVWKFDDFLLAEHHSVWDDGDQLADVTPPKFGGDRILFIRDDLSDLIQMGDVFVMWCDRSTLAQAPFLFNNRAQTEATFGLTPDNAAIASFCAQYGLNAADILTDPTYG
ncbi:hypothetical protein K5P26_14565 [Sphingopyxis sp. XHP0097]|uniref:Uncharacterized protein n=1 Tax=Sphingopyxis jiangsuensis TaxID=2871171 RepID=A0ABS7MHD0_9SPHN|nr:hypothetical protein [Sphingopyxis jiangsuensis]MBY4638364.1 hypothetical protein [Sphingopyxis jiangsuensis]